MRTGTFEHFVVIARERRLINLTGQIIGIGVHTWLWVGLLYVLLFVLLPAGGSAWVGLVYLSMSELCLHGFLFHPYLGFFLGVHRSRIDQTNEAADCQPTMSTYSAFASEG